MKIARISLILALLGVASSALAVNVPSGVTGLWRFQTQANMLKATLGTDLGVNSGYAPGWMTGPWTEINPGLSDNGILQESSWNYLAVTHGIAANGGGAYVNQYTVAIDYVQTSETALWEGNYYNSLFQTATGNGNDGDLFIKGPSRAQSVIGNGATGYSTSTFDSSTWHRIVWSVDNANFFRVYVDGVQYLDAAGQGVDGRFSLDPTFLLFADNDWEDAWGFVGTAATWNRALTSAEVAGMGGWLNGSDTPTPLVLPEPATLAFLSLGGFALLRRRHA
jgi:hypothetical protein